MKKWIAMLAAALMCLTMTFSMAEETRTITVTGSATILTDADSARLSLGVVSVAKEAEEASQANAAQVAKLIAALQEAGIAERDITTDYYYVSTRRDYNTYTDSGEYPVIGYEVNNNLTVIVREMDQVGAMIDIALANGANSCDGVNFSTTQAEATRDEALAAAIQEGKRRAKIMADACEGELGEILSIRENYTYGGAVLSNKRSDMVASEEDAGAGTSILSDGLSFNATVEMTFELK